MEVDFNLEKNPFSLNLDLETISKEIIIERLTSIYNEILSIEQEFPDIKFNKNISFINKINRHDPLFIDALKVVKIADCVLTSKTLSEKDLFAIATEFIRLKDARFKTLNQYENVKIILKTAKTREIFYKAIAVTSYYEEFKIGQTIETAFGNYLINSILDNDEGLKVLYFEPLESYENIYTPILSIRGTISGHIGNILDDLHASIGSLAFQAGKDELFNLFSENYFKFPEGFVLVGHSLGGSIAQQIAAAFVKEGFIRQVYYYNAPGVGSHVVSEFIESCRQSSNYPEIIEVRHESDLISYFGGEHLPLTHRVVVKDPEVITYLAAHEILRMLEKSCANAVTFEVIDRPSELSFWHGRFSFFTIETLRWTFAPILRFAALRWFANVNGEEVQQTNLESSSLQEFSEEGFFLQKHQIS